jgi:hypothetical protein
VVVLNEPTPIVPEYGSVAKRKRITTILMHQQAAHLNASDRRVLKKVAAYERREEGCRLSQANLGKQVGLSREQVNRILGKLDQLGFILRARERRPNGSWSTDTITLNDAFIRQVLGLEPMLECHTVMPSGNGASVVSPGEKCHTVMSHGMSHGMSHLEVEAKASTVGSPLRGRQEAKSFQGVSLETADAVPTKNPVATDGATSRDLESLEVLHQPPVATDANPRDDRVARVDLPPRYDPLQGLIAAMSTPTDEEAS